MTNIKRIILAVSFISMVFAQSALAAKDNLPNGQPFQQLESAIIAQNAANDSAIAAEASARAAADAAEAATRAAADAQEAADRAAGDESNANDIAANQAAINGLNGDVTAINLRIDGIDAKLDAVGAQVDSNSAEIAEALAQIVATNANLASLGAQVDGNSADIVALQEDLGDLIARHQADIAALYTALGGVQAQIDGLIVENAALASELSDRVSELRGLIGDNAVAIDGLLLDVITLNVQVSTNTTRIDTLQSWRGSVDGQLADHSAQIATLNAELAALKSLVSNYHDPCLEFITVGQTITGELVNDGECTSDSRTSSYGVYSAQYYTFTLSSTKTVTIDMLGSTCSGGGTLYDPVMYLHQGDRDGSVISANDDNGCGYNSRITLNLGAGTYTIEATSYSYTQHGTFVLSVQ